MAKLASTRSKPDGMLVVPAGRELEFLHPLPVAALWGVGERTGEVLSRLGLRTVADVANAPLGMLRQALGEASAHHLHELAWARDPRRINVTRVEKSTGAETTFDTDVADPDVIRRTLLELASRVGARMRAAGHTGRTVAIKVRLGNLGGADQRGNLGGADQRGNLGGADQRGTSAEPISMAASGPSPGPGRCRPRPMSRGRSSTPPGSSTSP